MPMSIEQAKLVGYVLRKFQESETLKWTRFDDAMEKFSWLNDSEIATECYVMLDKQHRGSVRCSQDHPKEECMVPVILEAIEYILEDFEDTGRLPKKTRYMLEYYLSLSETGGIVYSNY